MQLALPEIPASDGKFIAIILRSTAIAELYRRR